MFSNHEYPELTVLSHYAEDMSRFRNPLESAESPVIPQYSADSLGKVGGRKFSCVALCTCEEYDLNKLISVLKQRYNLRTFFFPFMEVNTKTAVHTYVYRKKQVPVKKFTGREKEAVGSKEIYEKTGGEMFFFKDGSFVCWNVSGDEIEDIRKLLKEHGVEKGSYREGILEYEHVDYVYKSSSEQRVTSPAFNPAELRSTAGKGEEEECGERHRVRKLSETEFDEPLNCINFSSAVSDHQQLLEKYAFSNGLQLSVKLGIWESLLDEYIRSMGEIPRNMKDEKPLGLSRKEIMKKTGELLYLRHNINLLSDLLDTPDFYWDRPELETYFSVMYSNLDLKDRTQVINNKLNYSHELAEVLRTHLQENHSLKLEWCIIGLITVEVVFECIHYADRYLS